MLEKCDCPYMFPYQLVKSAYCKIEILKTQGWPLNSRPASAWDIWMGQNVSAYLRTAIIGTQSITNMTVVRGERVLGVNFKGQLRRHCYDFMRDL